MTDSTEESLDGVPFHNSTSYDSCDSDQDDVSASATGKTNTKSYSHLSAAQEKPQSKASRLAMTLKNSSNQGSVSAVQLSNPDKRTEIAGVKIKTAAEIGSIKMKIGAQKCKESPAIGIKRPNELVAKVFNPEESDEEEMPPEAKMRMRNMGKNTPTAEGPNSFSKGRLGFCNRQKVAQRELDRVAVDQPTKKN